MPDDIQLRDALSLSLECFYTAKQSENCSPRTLAVYQDALDDFADWLRAHTITDAKNITPTHVRAFFADVGKRNYTAWTIHGRARPVKTFLRFLYFDDMIPTDVMAKVKMPKLDKPILPAFTTDDVKAILKACDNERDTALCLFLLDTGVRAAELCALTVADFNPKTGAVMVKHGKGAKGRMVYVDAKARRAVLKHLVSCGNPDEATPLFPSKCDGQPLTPGGLFQLIRRIGKRAHVEHCHPHTFRRTFALWSLRAGMDLMRLAALMGHSDLTVLRQYLDLSENDVQDAHQKHGAVAAMRL